MKVMKVKSRNYKGKQYYKYRINLPEKEIKKARVKEGDELYVRSSESKQGRIVLEKKEEDQKKKE